ncbi:MAG: GTPase HflX [Planctomycetota bacterium]|jgi:GTP-binding protein HflX
MAELKRTDLGLRAERAVLAQVAPSRDGHEADLTFEELESLARTAGAIVVGRLRQHRDRPDRRHYVGKGKLRELRALCAQSQPDVVVCDDELSPAQVKSLEAALDVKVVDRSEVILDIFAAHARTKQAKLQVELAQLEYEFPRLKRMWTHLDRTAGGTLGGPAGGGIGVRGPGEKQLEVDRRLVQRRIHDLKRNLERIQRRRHTMAAGRREQFATVALVGYTNAGKSSLMNALTGAGVSVKDHLFETLDTRTRRWELPSGRELLLSDTVGFVRKFPHHLAASFHATLEEAREADLLLHVVDASRHESEQEIRAVNAVLEEIDCLHKPTVYLLNKIDLVEEPSEVALMRKLVGEVICTSARTREGLDEVRQRVAEHLEAGEAEFLVRTGAGNGRLLSFLHANAQVLAQQCEGDSAEVRVLINPQLAGVIRNMGGEVTEAPA